MDIKKIAVGKNPPYDVNVVIEISAGGAPIKYEIDKDSGALFVDRFLSTAMYYPANYGFIPHTLGDDGDPIDALVIGRAPIAPGAVIRARPIGVIMMEDEAGGDEKIVMVPVDKLCSYYSFVKSPQDLSPLIKDQLTHFFEHYKDLELNKWVKVSGWEGPDKAAMLIEKAMNNYAVAS